MSGEAALTARGARSGRDAAIVDVAPGELLAGAALLQQLEPCRAVAKTACEVLVVGASAFTEFLPAAVRLL
jgi:CRP-like cAMP-binding protein